MRALAIMLMLLLALLASSAWASLGDEIKYDSDESSEEDLLDDGGSLPPLTSVDLQDFRAKWRDAISDEKAEKGDFLRLIFHDCIGGCDGCINFRLEDNRGLKKVVQAVEKIYKENNYRNKISRADLWAYFAFVSAKTSVGIKDQFNFKFQYGRKDCPTAPNDHNVNNLPPNTIGRDETKATFFMEQEFDFTLQETVAIMGIHNIARAVPENSGHGGGPNEGEFVEGQGDKFINNKYFRNLLKTNYLQQANTPQNKTNPHYQWNLQDEIGFMLNADLELYRDLKLDPKGRSGCELESCLLSSTAGHVKKYANNNSLFVEDFAAAFTKMLARGWGTHGLTTFVE